ncbi:MAG: hypothetical protein KGN74_10660 [Gemmatimonadota bacterium]|nr:hypothetical protein [Gemmatimonadota bacterium]
MAMKVRAWTLALAAGVATLAACGRRHGRTGQGPYADMVADAMPKIEKAVGVPFKSTPRLEVRTREQVRDFLLKKFDEQSPAAELAGQQAAYRAFGLIPDTLELRPFLVRLLTEQIVGYYDPSAKVLYIVKGAPDDLVGVTVTHELVHALQDQYVNLDSLQSATGDNDRQMAAQAVIEGEATYEQMAIMTGGQNIATLLPGGWDRVRELIRENESSQPVFASAPPAIQEELLFPYLAGAEFIREFKQHFPTRLPLTDIPVSTAQVLHPSKFFGDSVDVPVTVTLPRTAGQTVYENDLGEFDTRLLLYRYLSDQTTAMNAAQGWDGDRYRILREPAGTAVVWVTVWHTNVDAAEFVTALGQAMKNRYLAPAPVVESGGRRIYRGRGHTVVITPFTIGARDAVMLVDAPAGSATDLLDRAAIKLR